MFTQAYLPIILLSLVQASPIKRANNQLIVSARNDQCLSPAGGAAAVSAGQVGDGTPLIIMPCADAAGWDISPGSGSVLLTGTAYALDAGTTPGNNGQLKTWTSYPGSAPQTCYYTDDGRIALTGGDQCIDEGENGPQTYACTTGNTNQAWSIRNKAGGGGDDPAPPPEGVLPNVPRGDVFTDPAGGGRRIHPYNRDDLCLSTQGGEAAVGTPVQVTYCYPNDNPYTQYQLWETSTLTSVIRLASNTALCMDAGDNPSNNGGVKVWSCGDFPQQQWTQMQNQGTVQTANNQCLDIQVEGLPSEQPNYPNQGVLQTYQCYPGSQQQNFHLLNFE